MKLTNRLPVDDDEVPARRQEEQEDQEDLEMTEVLDNPDGLLARAVAELGWQQGGPWVYSPVKTDCAECQEASWSGQSSGSREDQKLLLCKLFCFS